MSEKRTHMAECMSRRPMNPTQGESVDEWMARTGQQPDRLNPWDVSPVNRLKGRYAS